MLPLLLLSLLKLLLMILSLDLQVSLGLRDFFKAEDRLPIVNLVEHVPARVPVSIRLLIHLFLSLGDALCDVLLERFSAFNQCRAYGRVLNGLHVPAGLRLANELPLVPLGFVQFSEVPFYRLVQSLLEGLPGPV